MFGKERKNFVAEKMLLNKYKICKMLAGRKAQFELARKTIYWMIAGLIISMLVLAFALILGNYTGKLTSVPKELQAELISQRFGNVPECFAEQDNLTQKVFPGMLDLSKFSEERMAQCYATDKEKGIKQFNFRLKLAKAGKEVSTNNYYHKDDFTIYKEVLVRNEKGEVAKDQLMIYVQEKIGD